METQEAKPIPLVLDTYLAVITNSVGTTMFRNFYALVEGKKKDIVSGGELACGFFTSFILHNFKLIAEPHLTVAGTEKDLKASGWQESGVDELRPGCVLIWSGEDFDGEVHKHIGFYVGNQRAISTDSRNGVVAEHSYDFDGKRSIEQVYWHPRLVNDTSE